MSHTWKTASASERSDSVLNEQMPAINHDLDAVAKQRYDSTLRNDRSEIAVLMVFRYGLRSCHRSVNLLWWSGSVRLLVTGGRPALFGTINCNCYIPFYFCCELLSLTG